MITTTAQSRIVEITGWNPEIVYQKSNLDENCKNEGDDRQKF